MLASKFKTINYIPLLTGSLKRWWKLLSLQMFTTDNFLLNFCFTSDMYNLSVPIKPCFIVSVFNLSYFIFSLPYHQQLAALKFSGINADTMHPKGQDLTQHFAGLTILLNFALFVWDFRPISTPKPMWYLGGRVQLNGVPWDLTST